MAKSLSICLMIAVAFTLFLAPGAQSVSVCKIVYVKGEPKMMKAGSSGWDICKTGIAINNGDRVKTAKDEAVEISFSDDRENVIKIEGDSDIYVAKCDDPYTVNIVNGAVMALLNNLPKNSKFEVRTPAGLSGARGTGWRSATDGSHSTFNAYENSIYVSGLDASGKELGEALVVDSGFKAGIDRFERPGALEKLSEKDMERWDSWKADLADRQVEGDRTGGGGSSGASTGNRADRSSLDRADRMDSRMERNDAMRDNVTQMRDMERIEDRDPRDRDRRTNSDDGDKHSIVGGGT